MQIGRLNTGKDDDVDGEDVGNDYNDCSDDYCDDDYNVGAGDDGSELSGRED